MQILTGTSLTPRIVAGPLRFYCRPTAPIPQRSVRTVDEELLRFRQVQRQAVLRLAALYDKAHAQVGHEAASIFAIHAMLIEDEALLDGIHRKITDDAATAEWAIHSVCCELSDLFSAMDDPYMRARAADMQDIARHLALPLLGVQRTFPGTGEAIVVCDHFLPSEVMHMDERLLGLISQRGSLDSHTAVLLKAYHIPVIVGTEFGPEWDGHRALIDGFDGKLYLDPDEGTEAALRLRHQPKD